MSLSCAMFVVALHVVGAPHLGDAIDLVMPFTLMIRSALDRVSVRISIEIRFDQ